MLIKHLTSEAALTSRQCKAFPLHAYLTPGTVLFDRVAITTELHPWLHM